MQISVSLPEHLVEAVRAVSVTDRRKFSPMIAVLLEEALERRGAFPGLAAGLASGAKDFKGMDPKGGK